MTDKIQVGDITIWNKVLYIQLNDHTIGIKEESRDITLHDNTFETLKVDETKVISVFDLSRIIQKALDNNEV